MSPRQTRSDDPLLRSHPAWREGIKAGDPYFDKRTGRLEKWPPQPMNPAKHDAMYGKMTPEEKAALAERMKAAGRK